MEDTNTKIYDCFIFSNELDLLEIRLKILNPYIDYFVIVEADKTHRGKKKPLYFQENKKRFEKWGDKIIHIVVRDMPKVGIAYGNNWKLNSILKGGAWKLEAYQKNQIIKGLKNCNKEDIIMMSDLDEIPNPNKIGEMVEALKKEEVVFFSQKLYYYFINGFAMPNWIGTRSCKFETLRRKFRLSMNRFRHLWNIPLRIKMRYGKKIYTIKEGGWHFSYLGDEKFIRNKISSTCHFEKDKLEFKDLKKLKEKRDFGIDLFGGNFKIKYVKIDNSFPEEIIRNKEKYSKFIKKCKKIIH